MGPIGQIGLIEHRTPEAGRQEDQRDRMGRRPTGRGARGRGARGRNIYPKTKSEGKGSKKNAYIQIKNTQKLAYVQFLL